MQPPNIANQRGLLNDVHRGLGQQMFFWGRDVMTSGNLLIDHGFERQPSPGHQGTSCYRKAWRGGLIELHGHCAGWYPQEASEAPGFMFVRTRRCSYAHEQNQPVDPGCYETHQSKLSLQTQMDAARHFTAWLTEYEEWIIQQAGLTHRNECFAMFRKLADSKPWLPPQQALNWWQRFAANDARLVRARNFASCSQAVHAALR
ncbi:hypothetical protein [Prosthecobacter sp.]|uniref:hypothetical protein n=1 Tax=Prosthecobacter sp. TaxID=1965333 RepID=UPI002487A488|nr:hypothetical protein [Prosthecobacter sp.]MDI1312474.1 hypothetical protein [Prosthecobacter sp.]